MDKAKLKRASIYTALGVTVLIAGVLIYKKSKIRNEVKSLENLGFKCGDCTSAKKIICENKEGAKRTINCSLIPDIF